MWISGWGVGFTGSRVTPFVEEPLSETRVPATLVCSRPSLKPGPCIPGWKGARLLAPPASVGAEGKAGKPALSKPPAAS